MEILHAPKDVLSTSAKPVPIKSGPVGKVDKSILHLIDEMKRTLAATRDPEGVGLAAPQVGKGLQIFITKPAPNSEVKVFINPKILRPDPDDEKKEVKEELSKMKKSKKTKLEGCLSLPNIWGEVARVPKVTLSYIDELGQNRTEDFDGFISTIIQHEYDHLHGVLFPKRVLEQQGELYKSHKDEHGKDVFDPITI